MNRMRHTLATFVLSAASLLLSTSPEAGEVPYDPSLGVLGGSVSRSTFTSAVVNREPVDRISRTDNNHPLVYFFTTLKGMTGQKVIHRWEHNGQVVKEQSFRVGAPRWRTWSSIVLPQQKLGKWTVSVINDLNEVVWQQELDYVATVSQLSSLD